MAGPVTSLMKFCRNGAGQRCGRDFAGLTSPQRRVENLRHRLTGRYQLPSPIVLGAAQRAPETRLAAAATTIIARHAGAKMTTPAGWYPDPSGSGGQRYFDGANWTHSQAGAPVRKRLVWPWIVAGVLLLSFGGCGAVLMAATHLSSVSSWMGVTAAKGDPVSDGQFRFVVTDFSKASLQGDPSPRGEYVIAVVTVTNTGNERRSFLVQNQKLIDVARRKYAGADMSADELHHQLTTVLTVNSGITLTVRMRFDVPKGTKLMAIELHESASSAGVKVGSI